MILATWITWNLAFQGLVNGLVIAMLAMGVGVASSTSR
jgi:hypothetical protein